jgi:hypothetical protein
VRLWPPVYEGSSSAGINALSALWVFSWRWRLDFTEKLLKHPGSLQVYATGTVSDESSDSNEQRHSRFSRVWVRICVFKASQIMESVTAGANHVHQDRSAGQTARRTPRTDTYARGLH